MSERVPSLPSITDDLGLSDNEGADNLGLSDDAAEAFTRSKSPRKANIRKSSFAATPENERVLLRHVAYRDKDRETKQMVCSGLKRNRFCGSLEDAALDKIFDAMIFFAFEEGEAIVTEGDSGNYFFVSDEGALEVTQGGKHTNNLPPGTAFGGIALLYDCPRTASVYARGVVGVWGVSGLVFRKIMKEHAQAHYAENRKFLDCISAFDGLPEKQKERIGDLALVSTSFDAGDRVYLEGTTASAIRFVKKGELSAIVGATVSDTGELVGGTVQATFRAGDSFGVRALLYDVPHNQTVVAVGKCEVLCVGLQQLKLVLGDDLAECLRRNFVLSILKKLPVISQLSPTQQIAIESAMRSKVYEPGEPVEEGLQVVIVMDGEVSGLHGSESVTLTRSQWCQDEAMSKLDEETKGLDQASSTGNTRKISKGSSTGRQSFLQRQAAYNLHGLVAGQESCRLATLTQEDLVKALNDIGLSTIAGTEEAIDYMRKMLLTKKVPIFQGISEEQVNSVIDALVLHRYKKGVQIFRQGEVGNAFFVVAKGEVSFIVDGEFMKTLGRGTCFGDRALLFDKERVATVEVSSDEAELWSIDRADFRSLLPEGMLAELAHHSRLSDKSVTLKNLKHTRLVGAGAFGSVRLVEHRRTAMKYALKRVRKTEEGTVPDEVQVEISVLSALEHPMILRLVKTFRTDSSVYLLTELITGGDLYAQMNKMGLLNRKQAQFYGASLVLIMEVLHQRNIVYRDLKPENVMLDHAGYLKLVDFGLAKKLDDSRRTYTTSGTLSYMAPEVMRGQGYGTEVDIWAIGVVLYELVCGILPFDDDDDNIVLTAIMEATLEFPDRYNDLPGKNLIRALLTKETDQRLGAGINGFEEIKAHKFFKSGVSGNLFSKVIGREIIPPSVPKSEQYTDERQLEKICSLSDAEELGDGDQDGRADSILALFKQFDLNGDGAIDRSEMNLVFKTLDPTFEEADLDRIMIMADPKATGSVGFEDFVDWVFSGNNSCFLKSSEKLLDVHSG